MSWEMSWPWLLNLFWTPSLQCVVVVMKMVKVVNVTEMAVVIVLLENWWQSWWWSCVVDGIWETEEKAVVVRGQNPTRGHLYFQKVSLKVGGPQKMGGGLNPKSQKVEGGLKSERSLLRAVMADADAELAMYFWSDTHRLLFTQNWTPVWKLPVPTDHGTHLVSLTQYLISNWLTVTAAGAGKVCCIIKNWEIFLNALHRKILSNWS